MATGLADCTQKIVSKLSSLNKSMLWAAEVGCDDVGDDFQQQMR